jgi:surface protein
MFNSCAKFNQNLSSWDVSEVKDMSYMFIRCGIFNNGIKATTRVEPSVERSLDDEGDEVTYIVEEYREPQTIQPRLLDPPEHLSLNKWKTGKVTNMSEMFSKCKLFNDNLSDWDVTKVENMSGMFLNCENFTGTDNVTFTKNDIGKWNTESVTTMMNMFTNCVQFDANLTDWKVHNVEDMSFMFEECRSFNNGANRPRNPEEEQHSTPNVLKWITTKVTNMESMFKSCILFNSNLSGWDVSKVENMSYMFYGCHNFNGKNSQIVDGTLIHEDISIWNTSSVTNMSHMFEEALLFRANISEWDVHKVTDFTDFDKECCFRTISGIRDYTAKDVDAIRAKLPRLPFTGGKRTRHRNHRTRKGKRNRTKRYIKIYL